MSVKQIIIPLLILFFAIPLKAQKISKEIFSMKYIEYIMQNPGANSSEQMIKDKAISRFKEIKQNGFQLYKRKKYDKAIKLYESALDLYADADIYYKLGDTFWYQDPKKSIQSYQISTQLNHPKKHLAFYNIACLYSKSKDRENSLKNLNLAIDNGYSFLKHIEKDQDLTYLRSMPDWDKTFSALKRKLKDANGSAGGSTEWLTRSQWTDPLAGVDTLEFKKNGKFILTGSCHSECDGPRQWTIAKGRWKQIGNQGKIKIYYSSGKKKHTSVIKKEKHEESMGSYYRSTLKICLGEELGCYINLIDK